MATKKSMSKSARKVTKKQHTPDYYPIVKRMALGVDGATLSGNVVCDTGKLLSISNRRLYRYGMKYEVKVDLDMSLVTADTSVDVYCLANNWDVQRAFALAKKVYDEAYADERAMSTGQLARWSDFRIQSGVNSATEADPCTFDNATLALSVQNFGEHDFSSVDVGGTEKFFTWGAATSSLIDITNEWIEAGKTSADPAVLSTAAPYAGVNSDQLSDKEQEHLADHGNNPPYNATADSDALVKVATLHFRPAPHGTQRLSTGYFHAPCGLVILKTNSSMSNGSVMLEAKSGDYKGVAASKMCQE